MTARPQRGKISEALLGWYDKHRRVMPWRAPKGKKADPYHVWLSEVMLQQTTVPTVGPYFLKFIAKWPSVKKLADAPQEEVMREWAGLGYYARARNLHKCAKAVANDLNGIFPQTQQDLKTLPGIGDYTSAAITAIAFNKPATVIDGNVDRVIARLFAIETPMPAAKTEIREQADKIYLKENERPGDLAQAFMDLGATICTPTSPKCALCPVFTFCKGHKKEIAALLPVKAEKKTKPRKAGFVYLVMDAKGDILVHRRPENMMMGGMLGLPTSDWLAGKKKAEHPAFLEISGIYAGRKVRHSFTHFDLELTLATAECRTPPTGYQWLKAGDLAESGFPTLFKKALPLFEIKE